MRLCAAALALSFAAAAPAAEPLTLATWNLEWMMTPQAFDAFKALTKERDYDETEHLSEDEDHSFFISGTDAEANRVAEALRAKGMTVEVNPKYDVDNRTTKLVAVAMHQFCSSQPKISG